MADSLSGLVRRALVASIGATVLLATPGLLLAGSSPEEPAAAGPTSSPGVTVSPSPSAESFAASASPVVEDGDPSASGGDVARPTVTVEAGDMWFAPNEIVIRADEATSISLVGVGQLAHNLIVDDLGLQLHVGPGITSQVDVSDLPPGTYPFYCSIYGHRRAGMAGTLTIQ